MSEQLKAPAITEGSWFADGRGIFCGGILIAKGAFVGSEGVELSEANAKILAAAPALAKALHEAYERYVCTCGYVGCAHCAYSREAKTALLSAGYTESSTPLNTERDV